MGPTTSDRKRPGRKVRKGFCQALVVQLNICWVSNAGLSNEQLGDVKNWVEMASWAANLEYGGYDDWWLASVSVAGGVNPIGSSDSVVNSSTATEAECRDTELGYMYTYYLPGNYGDDKTGDQTVGDVTLTDTSAFTGLVRKPCRLRTARGTSTSRMAANTTATLSAWTSVGRFAPGNVEPRRPAPILSQRWVCGVSACWACYWREWRGLDFGDSALRMIRPFRGGAGGILPHARAKRDLL